MALAAFRPTHNPNNHDMNPQAGPSPPDTYSHGRNASSSSTMANNSIPFNHWENPNRLLSTESYATNVRHMQPRRKPLGLPAALRPTDHIGPRLIPTPPRPTPVDTPPDSLEGQPNVVWKSNAGGCGDYWIPTNLDTTNGSEYRYGYGSIVGNQVTEEELNEVKGPPTTAHWKPDVTANACAECHTSFTWFFRRHHCRCCGGVVCWEHCKATVPLDHNARFHDNGEWSKACNRCANEYKAMLKSRASSIVDSQAASPESSTGALPIRRDRREWASDENRVNSVARSEGFHWSTF